MIYSRCANGVVLLYIIDFDSKNSRRHICPGYNRNWPLARQGAFVDHILQITGGGGTRGFLMAR